MANRHLARSVVQTLFERDSTAEYDDDQLFTRRRLRAGVRCADSDMPFKKNHREAKSHWSLCARHRCIDKVDDRRKCVRRINRASVCRCAVPASRATRQSNLPTFGSASSGRFVNGVLGAVLWVGWPGETKAVRKTKSKAGQNADGTSRGCCYTPTGKETYPLLFTYFRTLTISKEDRRG